jgi:drug/metabolite transporter (DMT)-like permease
MKRSIFQKDKLPIIAELSVYILLIISIISGVTFNVLSAATNTNGFFDLFFTGLISLFTGIGFIVIILEVAKRWRYIGGAVFLGLAISMLFWIPSSYNGESGIFYNYPYLIAPALVIALSWAVSGVIIIIHGKFLSAETTASPPGA